jgi:hypothetical protein
MNSVQSNNFECFHWSIYNFCTLHTAEHSSPCSIVECPALCSVRPFNLKEAGFFPKCPPFFVSLLRHFFSLHELLSQTPFSLFSFTLFRFRMNVRQGKKRCVYTVVSMRKTAKTNHRMKPYSKCLQKGNDHDCKTRHVSQSGVLIILLAKFNFTNSRFFKLTCDCTLVNFVIYCINTSFLPLPHVQSKAVQGKGK